MSFHKDIEDTLANATDEEGNPLHETAEGKRILKKALVLNQCSLSEIVDNAFSVKARQAAALKRKQGAKGKRVVDKTGTTSAERLSQRADKGGNRRIHGQAADAHERAREFHDKAGNKAMADFHLAEFKRHAAISSGSPNFGRKSQRPAENQYTPNSLGAILNGGPGSGRKGHRTAERKPLPNPKDLRDLHPDNQTKAPGQGFKNAEGNYTHSWTGSKIKQERLHGGTHEVSHSSASGWYVYDHSTGRISSRGHKNFEEATKAAKEASKKPTKNEFVSPSHITANFSNAKVRKASMGGRDYLVAPLTLIVPGVLNGSKGALYYPPEEVAKDPSMWNNTPIVVNHPTQNGVGVSAREPKVMHDYCIGSLMRTRVHNGKLKAEGWFDIENTKRIDPRIYQSLLQGQPMELSTGLFTENEEAPAGSHYNGTNYQYIARNYKPDHLAILPDQKGACSMKDGCGMLVDNQEPTDNGGVGSGRRGHKSLKSRQAARKVGIGHESSAESHYVTHPPKHSSKVMEIVEKAGGQNVYGQPTYTHYEADDVAHRSYIKSAVDSYFASLAAKKPTKNTLTSILAANGGPGSGKKGHKTASKVDGAYYRGEVKGEDVKGHSFSKSKSGKVTAIHLHDAEGNVIAKEKGRETDLFSLARHLKSLGSREKTTTNAAKGSHNDLSNQLSGLIRGPEGDMSVGGVYVEDVFDDYVVYRSKGKFYRRDYTVDKKGKITLQGIPTEVVRETSYSPVGNKSFEATLNGGLGSGRKGHRTSKSKIGKFDFWKRASNTAVKATRAAKDSEPESHLKAAKLHEAAATEHGEAASFAVTDKRTRYHMRQQDFHTGMARKHQVYAKGPQAKAEHIRMFGHNASTTNNRSGLFSTVLNGKEPEMAKLTAEQRETLVEGLITNNCGGTHCAGCKDKATKNEFTEDDREALKALTDNVLLGIARSMKEEHGKLTVNSSENDEDEELLLNDDPDDDDDEDEDEVHKQLVRKVSKRRTPMDLTKKENQPGFARNQQMTFNEYLEEAPSEVKEVLAEAKRITDNEKKNIILKLVANVGDKTQKKALVENFSSKPLEELRLLSALAPKPAPKVDSLSHVATSYMGTGAPLFNVSELETNSDDECDQSDMLMVPTINYGYKTEDKK